MNGVYLYKEISIWESVTGIDLSMPVTDVPFDSAVNWFNSDPLIRNASNNESNDGIKAVFTRLSFLYNSGHVRPYSCIQTDLKTHTIKYGDVLSGYVNPKGRRDLTASARKLYLDVGFFSIFLGPPVGKSKMYPFGYFELEDKSVEFFFTFVDVVVNILNEHASLKKVTPSNGGFFNFESCFIEYICKSRRLYTLLYEVSQRKISSKYSFIPAPVSGDELSLIPVTRYFKFGLALWRYFKYCERLNGEKA